MALGSSRTGTPTTENVEKKESFFFIVDLKLVKKQIENVILSKVGVEVEYPPLKVKGRIGWQRQPASVRSKEQMK